MLERLFTILVNWNLKADTIECIESLLAAGATPGRIIVVDNGSTDGSVDALQRRFGESITIRETGENLGFAGGVNQGLMDARSANAVWVLLLNNDTLVAADFLNQLAQAVATAPEYAIWAPLIYYHAAPERIWHLGARIYPGTLATYSLKKDQPDKGNLPAIVPVDFVTGCGMLIRGDVFERIGLFDPAFFMYGEEVDFCWRARRAGFRTACATRAHIWHKVSLSANRDRAASRYHRIRNQIRFYRKHATGLQRTLMWAFSSLRLAWLAAGDLWHRTPHLLAPLGRGWRDGWYRND
ncbi:MAG: glycosyltransferase family 2 protein [Chloroflexota bacterium]